MWVIIVFGLSLLLWLWVIQSRAQDVRGLHTGAPRGELYLGSRMIPFYDDVLSNFYPLASNPSNYITTAGATNEPQFQAWLPTNTYVKTTNNLANAFYPLHSNPSNYVDATITNNISSISTNGLATTNYVTGQGYVTAMVTNPLVASSATNTFVDTSHTNQFLDTSHTNGFASTSVTNGLVGSVVAGTNNGTNGTVTTSAGVATVNFARCPVTFIDTTMVAIVQSIVLGGWPNDGRLLSFQMQHAETNLGITAFASFTVNNDTNSLRYVVQTGRFNSNSGNNGLGARTNCAYATFEISTNGSVVYFDLPFYTGATINNRNIKTREGMYQTPTLQNGYMNGAEVWYQSTNAITSIEIYPQPILTGGGPPLSNGFTNGTRLVGTVYY